MIGASLFSVDSCSYVDKAMVYRAASMKSGFKKPGKTGMNMYRAVLITGPPGIGKTTSAHLCAKLEGFTPIELNASDARSKKLVEVSSYSMTLYCILLIAVLQNGMNINNTSLDGFIHGAHVRNLIVRVRFGGLK
jgi:replication factor C subunit 1